MDSEQKARFLLNVVEDRKAVEPVLLDLRGKTLLFDFSLICSGTSNVHIRAIADAVLEKSEEADLNKPRATGQESAEWVLLDFGDVVLHILDEDSRERYQLEKFWSTPQPRGALPPTPDSVLRNAGAASVGATAPNEDDGEDVDAVALDDEDREDADFFDEADREVEPVDEDDLDDMDDEDLDRLDDEDLDDLDEEDLDDDEFEEEDEENEDGVNGDDEPRRLR